MSCCVNSLILPCTHLLFTSQSISIYITLYTPVVYQSVHIYLYYIVHTCCLPVSPYLAILRCTHLLFTSQSISIYITLYTPVVYQSVHIYLYYPVHTCCLPVSPHLSILPCTHLLFTSQSISFYITLYTPVVYQSVHIYQRGEFHISHDASRQISVFSPRWKERSRVSREIFNDLNFKVQLIQGKFQ